MNTEHDQTAHDNGLRCEACEREATTTKRVEDIKRGEYVTRKPGGKVYERGEYDRTSRKFSLVDALDMNREIFVKKGTLLHVGFSY